MKTNVYGREINLMLPKTEKFPPGQDNCIQYKTVDEMLYNETPTRHMKTWSSMTD